MPVPELRIRQLNSAPPNLRADYLLYWMTAFRRTRWNFALQRAVELAVRLDKPLLVLEALRVDYRWASDRFHRFVMEGMADNDRRLAEGPVCYYPYVEQRAGDGRGLLAALAKRAAVVVADDHPGFFLRRMVEAARHHVPVRFEAVDSNGLLPLAAADRVFPSAFTFRRFLHRSLRPHLTAFPLEDPIDSSHLRPAAPVPDEISRRWPVAQHAVLADPGVFVNSLPIDHAVGATSTRGGGSAATTRLQEFLHDRFDRYQEDRHHPDRDASSGLSPYLHFGHISTHEIFAAVMSREGWTTRRLGAKATGQREGWWGASASAESFLDELITWREVGYNMFHLAQGADRYESLPAWARASLEAHLCDPREHTYTLAQFETASTHDPLWNAAQMQLVQEGRVHTYLRMLWGKKIVQWTAHPRDALDVMIELNNKYALDGRDPNSYSGMLWVLGRYDRPWSERPIFGAVRYMSSENTVRKLRVREYVRKYAPDPVLLDNRATLFNDTTPES